MKYSIDRIENDFAVCIDDNENKVIIPLNQLPFSISEGDILERANGKYKPCPNETLLRKEENFSLEQNLFKNTDK